MPTLLRTQWLSWLGNAIALLLMTSSGSAPDERRLLVSESAHRSTCQDVASIPSIQYSKHTVQQAYSTAHTGPPTPNLLELVPGEEPIISLSPSLLSQQQ